MCSEETISILKYTVCVVACTYVVDGADPWEITEFGLSERLETMAHLAWRQTSNPTRLKGLQYDYYKYN